MAKTFTDTQRKGEFLMSRGNGDISMERVTLTAGQKVADGRVVSLVSGKAVVSTGANSAGVTTETVIGVAYGSYDATVDGPNGAVDTPMVVVVRHAEVKANAMQLHGVSGGGAAAATTAIIAALKANAVIIR